MVGNKQSIYLTDEAQERLEQLAQETGLSYSRIVQQLILQAQPGFFCEVGVELKDSDSESHRL